MKKIHFLYGEFVSRNRGECFHIMILVKKKSYRKCKNRALGMVDVILSFKDIKPAGREEWYVVKNFILGYDKLG